LPKPKVRLVIVGCGGFGRETLDWASHSHGYDQIGMIDDAPDFERFPRLKAHYLGTTTDFSPAPNDELVIAIGDPTKRSFIDAQLRTKGATFGSVIHPTSLISPSSTIGEGAVLAPFTVVTTDVHIGRHAHLNIATTIGHDVKLGNFVTLSSHTDITGGCTLGDRVFLGSGARILPACNLAAGTRVGAGCVVMRSVRETSVLIAPRPTKVLSK
jgi:sugar O-acyltransferase (sialic acid O-acetyltransferase NeuD family)